MPRFKLGFLSTRDIEEIHEASLRILREVGVKIFHKGFLERLAEAGAKVDFNTALVKLNESIIIKSIEQAGKKFIIYGRNKNKVARFGYGDGNFLSTASQIFLIDPIARKRYIPTLKDAQDCIRVTDALENIEVVGAFVSASDVPEYIRDVRLYMELIKNTSKPCYTWINNKISAKYILEMFKVVSGGEEKLRNSPMLMAIVEPASVLQYGRNMLAGVVVSQMICPEIPVLYWGIPHTADMRNMNLASGAPEQALMGVSIAQIAQFYGLPVGVDLGLTDSVLPDAQSGLEKGITSVMGLLAGADLYGHMGILGKDAGGCLAQLIIDDEMHEYLKRLERSFEINEETLAFDVIKRVGINGNYITDEHTLKHYKRELWNPELMQRSKWEMWEKDGKKSMLERAVDKQNYLLKNHTPEPLDEDLLVELVKIVKVAEKELRDYRVSDGDI